MKNLFSFFAAALLTAFVGQAQCEADHTVEASSFQYAPADLTIEAGESVAFLNMGGFHDVNFTTNSITSEPFNNPADVGSLAAVNGEMGGVCMGVITFDTPGTYNYDCSIGNHAAQGMVGTVTVNAPPSNTVVDVIVNSPDHELLEAAVIAAGLVDALSADGPFTVFAPTDAAIGALAEALMVTAEELLALEDLPAILQYHVVAGTALSTDLSDGQTITTLLGEDVTVTITADGVFINNAQVTVADILADNGVVHVIDTVLIPPTPETTIWDVVVNSEDHNYLEAAVDAAGLSGALSGTDTLTLFAPTDAAFEALATALAVEVTDLLALPNLGEILQYHVVAGAALSTDLSDGQEVATLLGETVTVTITADGVFINDAQVVVADILTDNGVVHVIDTVLLPPTPETTTIWDVVVNSEDHNYLEAAVDAAGLSGALSGTDTLTLFAPTDAAFEALATALAVEVTDLLALPNLGEILQYHVVAGAALSTDLSDGQEVATLLGETVTVTITADGVFINDAQVVVADILTDNGVVHVIDAVLLPPTTDGLNEVAAAWSMMPNPATDVVTLTGLAQQALVTVYDLSGRVVQTATASTSTVVLSDLQTGTYLVAVRNGASVKTQKLVVR